MYENIILIPFRNRKEHLDFFLKELVFLFFKYLKPFKIIIIEQSNDKEFNRAKLLNIGFYLFKDNSKFFFHHDVDIIPNEETVKNIYTMSNYNILRIFNAHASSLGGIVKFDKESFEKINGLPNYIWGWGIEDRCFFYRAKIHKLSISENLTNKENFIFLNHKSNAYDFEEIKNNISNYEDFNYLYEDEDNKIKHINFSGLNNLDFEILERKEINSFIELIKVDI